MRTQQKVTLELNQYSSEEFYNPTIKSTIEKINLILMSKTMSEEMLCYLCLIEVKLLITLSDN